MKRRTLWVCLPCTHDNIIRIEYILEIVLESDQLELFDVADSTAEINEWFTPTSQGMERPSFCSSKLETAGEATTAVWPGQVAQDPARVRCLRVRVRVRVRVRCRPCRPLPDPCRTLLALMRLLRSTPCSRLELRRQLAFLTCLDLATGRESDGWFGGERGWRLCAFKGKHRRCALQGGHKRSPPWFSVSHDGGLPILARALTWQADIVVRPVFTPIPTLPSSSQPIIPVPSLCISTLCQNCPARTLLDSRPRGTLARTPKNPNHRSDEVDRKPSHTKRLTLGSPNSLLRSPSFHPLLPPFFTLVPNKP